ncbi:hypothetical protein A9Q99_16870 [Gammaproteobacteria bacterium 45_16_T64]|nr:hypothetical protein A9Q99_16870 [Gammaproteobacteria bacterium 45_16_T64]
MDSTEAAAKPNRTSRRKQKTKDKLLKAIQILVLERGLNEISINDITEQADVGLGTFYNYFDSKESLIQATSELLLAYYHQDIDAVTEGLTDPAEIMAASIMHTLSKAVDGTQWGKFIFESNVPIEAYAMNMRMRGMRDIRRGIDEGRFEADEPEIILSMFTGFALAVAGDVYFGFLPKTAIVKSTAKILTLLGIKEEAAKEIAQKKYPTVKPVELPISVFDLEQDEA